MALRVVGAGLPRTGTNSLKVALERLLGGTCYHMFEVYEHAAEHAPLWKQAAEGEVDWRRTFLDDYVAAVDWPASHHWRALAAAYPDALILLSKRSSVEAWWASIDATVFANARHAMQTGEVPQQMVHFGDAMRQVLEGLSPRWWEHDAAVEGYERHLERVRAEAPADRLLEWQPGDGWQPLCDSLGVAVPDEPFPHVNSRDDFAAFTRDKLGGP